MNNTFEAADTIPADADALDTEIEDLLADLPAVLFAESGLPTSAQTHCPRCGVAIKAAELQCSDRGACVARVEVILEDPGDDYTP